jgi:hypothetical protein
MSRVLQSLRRSRSTRSIHPGRPTPAPEPAQVLSARRVRTSRPSVLLAAFAGATLLLPAMPASAAPAPFPSDGGDLSCTPVLTADTSQADAVRSALDALPNRADIHVDQILKNLVTGAMP